MTSRRGHDFGWLGLTLADAGAKPPEDIVRRHVAALTAEI
jgi:hypothetical protein